MEHFACEVCGNESFVHSVDTTLIDGREVDRVHHHYCQEHVPPRLTEQALMDQQKALEEAIAELQRRLELKNDS